MILPAKNSDMVIETLQSVLDVPALWSVPGYSGLTGMGLASGTLTYPGFFHSVFSVTVTGTM